ncbi:hypothetical protein [uncultured Amnibacterium sp.]|uniref:hypothetical protein n=1 Tax=uncultured Amnibacterium sp. TaxID=1631851 RepID=UPI0035CAC7C4
MVGQGVHEQAILDAVGAIEPVRAVLAVTISEADGRPLIALRVGLPATLGLPEVVRVVGQVQGAVARVAPGARVFVEPESAVDPAAPTEAILIRALE